jgi:hypothetical protein
VTRLPRASTAVYLQEFRRIEQASDLQRKSPGVRGFSFGEALFSEETSLVKRVPPPGTANPHKTSPTENSRTDHQRSVVPRCYRTLGNLA